MTYSLVRTLAIHEAGHAVMAGAVATSLNIAGVYIAQDGDREGRCEWINPPPEPTDDAAAIAFAGPLAQVLYAPDSLGRPNIFSRTICHSPSTLRLRGLVGWYGSHDRPGDLRYFARRDSVGNNAIYQALLPATSLDQIQDRTRTNLARPGPRAAVEALSQVLEEKGRIAGPDAERIIQAHLAVNDYLAPDYFSAPG